MIREGVIEMLNLSKDESLGIACVNDSEMVVLRKIRESKDPEQAIQIATNVILDYLKQRESSQSRLVALQQELYAAT